MINNLKIALQKQKKLIALFLLTILVPSLLLSIFGVTAIRNEKFRLAQQFENKHKRIADFLKKNISSRLNDLEKVMQSLVQLAVFSERDFKAIKDLLNNRLVQNAFVEQIIIIYEDDDAYFPLFPVTAKASSPMVTSYLTDTQQIKLKRAQEFEYIHKNYSRSQALYNELLISLKDRNEQARMLNHIARNLMKQNKYQRAIKIYNRIIEDYTDARTSSNLPLLLIAQLQKIECQQQLRDFRNSLKHALYVYNEVLHNSQHLNEDQFYTYADIIKEKITYLLSQSSLEEAFGQEYELLEAMHRSRLEQWQIISDLKNKCIPEIREKIIGHEPIRQVPIHYAKSVNQRNYLITGVLIPQQEKKNGLGLMGIMIKNEYLERELLRKLIKDTQLNDNTLLLISDLSGRMIYGNNLNSDKFYKITAFFEDNFPPWRIEISDTQSGAKEIFSIYKSFYFWTIITLLIILSFGLVLIVRTVAHEMEVLKIKSDFVSSVSHEFKTPLTSIKALTERLLHGKVKNPAKMEQYFSVIPQDTDRLTRLVGNILDFSKIEEGKKEYDFEETDVVLWLDRTLQNFKRENLQRVIEIKTQLPNNVPPLKIDKNALTQAIYNLLDNAIKFSGQKKEVQVIVKKAENNLIIKISDHGIGIHQNELEKIFEKFYQGKNAIKYSAKGTGLGLTLVKHIVEAHRGEISVASKLGHGSTFSIVLPIKNCIK
jgi:signal transduction histidine kinase